MLTRLRGVAAHGLVADTPIAPEPLDEGAWRQLLVGVGRQRLAGLAARAAADGALATTEEQAADLAAREVEAAAASLQLERALLETCAVLDDVGVPVRILKGSAVAHLDYPDPMLRLFGDVDILLPADQVDRGIAALLDAGCTRPVAELAAGYDRRFGKGATLVRPDGVEIDVHRILVAGTFGMRFDSAVLFESEERFDLGGVALAALGRTDRFLHACYHAALGDPVPRLMAVRDVAQMAHHPGLRWPEVLGRAERWGGEAVVARAVGLCADVLAITLSDEIVTWADSYRPSTRDRRSIDACLRTDGRFARQALDALRDVPGVRAKWGYVRALAFPQTAHLAGRGRSRLVHLLRSVRRVRGRVQG